VLYTQWQEGSPSRPDAFLPRSGSAPAKLNFKLRDSAISGRMVARGQRAGDRRRASEWGGSESWDEAHLGAVAGSERHGIRWNAVLSSLTLNWAYICALAGLVASCHAICQRTGKCQRWLGRFEMLAPRRSSP